MARQASNKSADSTATLDLEAKLWLPAGKIRNNTDVAEHKQIVLGLIFLKYISDTFDGACKSPFASGLFGKLPMLAKRSRSPTSNSPWR